MSLKQKYFLWRALKAKDFSRKSKYFFALDFSHARDYVKKERNTSHLARFACSKKNPHSRCAVHGLVECPELLIEVARSAQTEDARRRAVLSLSYNFPELLPRAFARNTHMKTKNFIISLLSYEQLEVIDSNRWNIDIPLDEPVALAKQEDTPDISPSPHIDIHAKHNSPEDSLISDFGVLNKHDNHEESHSAAATPEKRDVLDGLRLPRRDACLETSRQTALIGIARSTTDIAVGLEVVELLRNNPDALMRIASIASGKTALLEVRKAAVDTMPSEFSLRQKLSKMSEKMLSTLGNDEKWLNICAQDERSMISYIKGLSNP